MAQQERVVYLNGGFLPESQAAIPFRDEGFIHGDAVFDTARTFNGQVFKLEEHIHRLYRSARYARINPELTKEEMKELTLEVVRRNQPLLGLSEDYWVTQRVTRGVPTSDGYRPTTLIECKPLPLAQRAHYYRDGIPVIVPSVRRVPPEVQSPQAKTHNYMNMVLGELEVKARDPDGWAVLLDMKGNMAEGKGSNIFIFRNGTLMTPHAQYVLPGVTRETVLELAGGLGIPTAEQDFGLFEAYTADEMFLTSTSLCVCPVASINGARIGDARIGDARVPGPVTGRLLQAFSDLVGVDIAAQYLAHLRE